MKRILYFLVIAVLFSCKNNADSDSKTEISVISPPLEGDFVNDTVFEIDPTVANFLQAPNGSSIEIPANAIVDKNGNLIEDKISVHFNQYHSAADIIASGIPMQYDSAGTVYTFESAGMFTLKAKSGDRSLAIKEGQAVNVNLASDKDDAFNFYALDESTGDWTYEHSPEPVEINPLYRGENRVLRPEPGTEDAFVLDLNFDHSDYAELSSFSGIVWEYVGENDSLDPRENKWINNVRWTDFELNPTHETAYEYYLTMIGSSRTFTTKVKAALSGEDYKTAMQLYQTKKVEIAQKMDQLQKPYIRSVSISGFGTFNYDYIHQMQSPQPIFADFNFNKQNEDKDEALVFVVYPNSQVTVEYRKNNWANFALDRAKEPKLMAILPGNKIAVFKDDLSKVYEKDKYTFNMHVLEEDIKDKQALERVVASL